MNDFTSLNAWVHQNPVYASYDSTYPLDLTQLQSPSNAIDGYNEFLQRAAGFYATMDTSDLMSSSGSESGRSSLGNSRRSSATTVIAEIQKAIPDKFERRREQNRSSQRAYRERKEQHRRDLEEQLIEWQQKHQQLTESYQKQIEEMQRMRARIDDLNLEVASLRTTVSAVQGSVIQSPFEFDLVPIFGISELTPLTE